MESNAGRQGELFALPQTQRFPNRNVLLNESALVDWKFSKTLCYSLSRKALDITWTHDWMQVVAYVAQISLRFCLLHRCWIKHAKEGGAIYGEWIYWQDSSFVWIKLCPCSAHAGHIGTDRSLLTGYDTLLLRQIARDLVHALSHRHDSKWTTFGEPVIGTGGEKLITCW